MTAQRNRHHERYLRLYKAGATPQQIADAIKVPRQHVYDWAKRRGYSFVNRVEFTPSYVNRVPMMVPPEIAQVIRETGAIPASIISRVSQ